MPHTWTRDLVCASIENAFRGRGGAFVNTAGEVERLLNYRLRAPEVGADDWLMLMKRSECRAGLFSVAERRRAFGWSAGRFERGWRRAADAISAALNVERMNRAAFMAAEQAEDRVAAKGLFSPGSDPPVTLMSRGERRG